MSETPRTAVDALNKLCKWRSVLAGWIQGTRTINAPGTAGMRDLIDRTLIVRAETTAMVELLVQKGVFTVQEFDAQVLREAEYYDAMLARLFPGIETTDGGVVMDPQVAAATMRRLHFPP